MTSSVPKRKYLFAERGAHACMLPTENNAGFDLSRTIISQRFKLIYNTLITLKFSPVDFAGTQMYRQLTRMHNEGILGEPFDSLYFNKGKRPLIELFDLDTDPYELHNLADDPVYWGIKKELLKELTGWMIRERDFLPTPDAILRLNNPNK